MKKIVILLIALLLLSPTLSFATEKKVSYVGITFETRDSFVIKSKLFYPAEKKEVYPIVVFLHSLGSSGNDWALLAKKFVDAGVATLVIDLRGHGQSIYDSNFKISSWLYFTPKIYEKYPNDIADIMKYVAANYKNISTKNYAIIGADIGANTAIIAAEKMENKPMCLALISPSRNFKGLYTPIAMTNIDKTSVLAMAGAGDRYSVAEVNELKKFAQADYETKIYPAGGMGMLMLKVNPEMNDDILNWVLSKINGETKVLVKK